MDKNLRKNGQKSSPWNCEKKGKGKLKTKLSRKNKRAVMNIYEK